VDLAALVEVKLALLVGVDPALLVGVKLVLLGATYLSDNLALLGASW